MFAASNYRLFRMATKWTTLSSRQVLLCVLSGVMLTASFPPGKLSYLAWFALVPLLVSVNNESFSQAFRLGFIAGIAHYLTLIYWVVVALGRYGGLNIFVSLGPYLLLCLYLALYPAIFSGLTTSLKDSRFPLTLMASFWVGLEYIRANILTGFPWCLLGYTQYKHLYLIQIADLCGVYGLSFMAVLINGLIGYLFLQHFRKSKAFLKWEALIIALAAGGTLAYGHYHLLDHQFNKQTSHYVNTLIVQGNIDQSVKWDPAFQTKTMVTYQRLTLTGYDFEPELIVWPETSVPFFFQDSVEFAPMLYSIANESKAALIFGSPAYEYSDFMINYFNRAYLIIPDNEQPQYYDKVRLVPFGEYIPLKKLLFFIGRLVPAAGDFKAGGKMTPLKINDLSAGILICFEAIFPELARAYARIDADILVNLTNDGWFGMTSAPYQHLSMAVFRAVENRRPMIRAANNGLSAFIRPQGEIAAISTLFNEEVLRVRVDIPKAPLTFYARFGDLFAFSLLVITLIKTLSYWWHRRTAGG
jgi:apolipoprotein N-acyltransferase